MLYVESCKIFGPAQYAPECYYPLCTKHTEMPRQSWNIIRKNNSRALQQPEAFERSCATNLIKSMSQYFIALSDKRFKNEFISVKIALIPGELCLAISLDRLRAPVSGSKKQVSRAGSSNYIPQYLWDVITCPCPWYLLLTNKSTIENNSRASFTFSFTVQTQWKFRFYSEPDNDKLITIQFVTNIAQQIFVTNHKKNRFIANQFYRNAMEDSSVGPGGLHCYCDLTLSQAF